MRDLTQLHPDLQKKAKELVTKCEKQGLKIKITECLRTKAEQDALYAQGRTKPGNKVTNASGSSYSSMHQWGVAFDFCRNDGKGAFNDNDGFFTKVGRIGQSIGLEWGGGWKSITDKPHFQLPNWGSTPTKLKQQYGTPDKFFKTWNKSTAVKEDTKKKTSSKAKTTKYKVTAKNGLWIRTEPTTKAKTLRAMPCGSVFICDKTSNGWAHGTWNGNTGWSSLTYLKKE
jgi:hypothetical protein